MKILPLSVISDRESQGIFSLLIHPGDLPAGKWNEKQFKFDIATALDISPGAIGCCVDFDTNDRPECIELHLPLSAKGQHDLIRTICRDHSPALTDAEQLKEDERQKQKEQIAAILTELGIPIPKKP